MNIDDIKRKILIEQVIFDDLGKPSLWKRSGDNIFTSCPFHKESRPSFSVSVKGQFFYCFGCRAHGDVIDWTAKRLRLSNAEAVATLAKRFDLEWDDEAADGLTVARAAMERFVVETQQCLTKNKEMLAYLHKRRVSDATIKAFRVGYSPGSSIATKIAAEYGEEVVSLLELDDPNLTKDAIILPIINNAGRVIRYYSHAPGAKYRGCSKKMPLWNKASNLYGLHSLKPDDTTVTLVEGFFDVLVPHSMGIGGFVALMGTTVNAEAIKALSDRGYSRVRFLFDGDDAGRTAYMSLREIDLPTTTFVSFCPDGHDPGDMTEAQLRKALREESPLIIWTVEQLSHNLDTKSAVGMIDFASRVTELCNKIGGSASRRLIASYLSKRFKVKIDEFDLMSSDVEHGIADENAETRLVQMAIHDAYAFSKVIGIPPAYFVGKATRETLMEMHDQWKRGSSHERILQHFANRIGYMPPVDDADESSVDYLCEQVIDRAVRREIVQTTRRIELLAADTTQPVGSVIAAGTAMLYGGVDTGPAQNPQQLADTVNKLVISRMASDTRITGYALSDRWTAINELWGGIEPKRYHLIAGLTSSGKSACAINWAVDLAVTSEVPCLYLSGELDPQDITIRVAAILSGVPCTKIACGDLTRTEHLSVQEAMREYGSGRLYVVKTRMYIAQWLATIETYVIKHGVRVVFIDYLQQLQRDREDRSLPAYQVLEQASARLQDRAYSDRAPVAIVAVSQLNRGAAEHGGMTGGAHFIGGAFGIAQDCDRHLQLIAKTRAMVQEHGSQKGNRIFINEKNRQGRQGHRINGYLDDGETYGTGTMQMGLL